MKAIGLGAGFLAFLAATLSAEAQVNIQGINPTSVLTIDQSCTYVAQISGAPTLYWKFCVTLGSQQLYGSGLFLVNGLAPCTVSTSIGMSGWGLAEGQTIHFTGKVGTSPRNLITGLPWPAIVDDPTTYLPVPDSRTSPHGLRGELYAAIVKDEEELLA